MRRKVFMAAILVLVFSMTSIGTYSFLVNKTTNPNVVSTGTFPPKLNVKLYAASGPVFKEETSGQQNQQSISYPGWLDDASKYIIKDLTGQVLNTSPANKYETYENIANNSKTTTRKKTIVSANFYSWEGTYLGKDNQTKDNRQESKQSGTTMHHIIVLENSKRFGGDSPKIRLNTLEFQGTAVGVKQYDVFKGKTTNSEYIVERPSSEFDAGATNNRTRVRTFNYDKEQNKYVRVTKNDKEISNDNQGSNGVHPADEADMIIFDVGGEGYYAPPNEKNDGEQEALDNLFERLCGRQPFIKNQNSNPFSAIMDDINSKESGLVRLDRSVCEITLKKNGTEADKQTNTVLFSVTE